MARTELLTNQRLHESARISHEHARTVSLSYFFAAAGLVPGVVTSYPLNLQNWVPVPDLAVDQFPFL